MGMYMYMYILKGTFDNDIFVMYMYIHCTCIQIHDLSSSPPYPQIMEINDVRCSKKDLKQVRNTCIQNI